MEKQRFDASVLEFWYLVGDDLHQHLREFHAEGFIHKGVEAELEETLDHLEETRSASARTRSPSDQQTLGLPRASHLLHGVQELGELVEALPVLAGVLLPLDDGLSQLLDVRHPDLIEHRLALHPVLWDCTQTQTRWLSVTGDTLETPGDAGTCHSDHSRTQTSDRGPAGGGGINPLT